MMKKVFVQWLSTAGRGALTRFARSILSLGSREEVVWSQLLFEQGLWVLGSAMNTAAAFQASRHFVLPYWLEKQWNFRDKSFVPTGAGLLCSNLTHRNWTSLGIPGVANEILVDPVGMITPIPNGPSYLPFMRMDDAAVLPPREQDVCQTWEACAHAVLTTYRGLDNVVLEAETGVAFWEDSACGHVVLRVRNLSSETRRVAVGLALRPYNPLSVGHAFAIARSCQKVLEVDGQTSLVCLETPSRVVFANTQDEDPLFLGRGSTLDVGAVASNSSGILFVGVEYECELLAGKTREIVFRLPAKNSRSSEESIFARSPFVSDVERLREDAVHVLNQYEKGCMGISIADVSVQALFQTAISHVSAFDDGDNFSPGTYQYHHGWLRDGYFLMQASLNAGLHKALKQKCERLLTGQKSCGLFENVPSEWDGNGQAIATLVEYCRKTGDRSFLEHCFPFLIKGARWIFEKQQKEFKSGKRHAGLMPMSFSAEHFGPIDSYFWDAMWSVHGVRSALWAAEFLESHAVAKLLGEWNRILTQGLTACIEGTLCDSKNQVLPTSPYRFPDAASVGCLAACDPLELGDIEGAWMNATVDFLMRDHFSNGLLFHPIFHMGLNPYLSVQVARVLLAKGDARWLRVLQGLVQHASSTGTWPEGINPLTKGGCMGDGHHGWANAEYINLVRNAFVLDLNSELILGHGVDEEWVCSANGLCVENAPTRHGFVRYSVFRNGSTWKWVWDVRRHDLVSQSTELFLSLPFAPQNVDSQKRGQRFLVKSGWHGEASFERGD